jgi:hypothetical protein
MNLTVIPREVMYTKHGMIVNKSLKLRYKGYSWREKLEWNARIWWINVSNRYRCTIQVAWYSLIVSYNSRVESFFLWMIDSTDYVVQGMLGKSWGTWVQRLQWSDISAFFQINFPSGWRILLLWVCTVEAYCVFIALK